MAAIRTLGVEVNVMDNVDIGRKRYRILVATTKNSGFTAFYNNKKVIYKNSFGGCKDSKFFVFLHRRLVTERNSISISASEVDFGLIFLAWWLISRS